MKCYFFTKTLKHNLPMDKFGFGIIASFQSSANDFYGYEELLTTAKKELGREITAEELSLIACVEMNFDYYTIQYYEDGLGNDTYVSSSYKTYEEAKKHATKDCKIVGQNFGEFNNWW